MDINKNKLQACIDSLFFKVFRNLVIRNKIISFIKCGFKINKYEYNSIISTEFMIKNGLFQLLYEKVKHSEYLIFNNDINGPNYRDGDHQDHGSRLLNNYKELKGRTITKKKYSIFNCFKTTAGIDEYNKNSKGYQFYKSLFKNYSNQFPSKDQLFTIGIEYDNVSILHVLSDEYSITPQSVKEQLVKSINIGSFQASEFIFKKYEWYSDLSKETVGIFQEQFEKVHEIKLFNEKVQFLTCKLKYPSSNVSEMVTKKVMLYNGLFKMLIFQKSLQLVIDCCRTLINLKLESYFQKDFTQLTKTNINDIDYDSNIIIAKYKIYKEFNNYKLPTIESFENMISDCNFTNNEMKSKIYDLEYCSGIVGEEKEETNKDKLEALIHCFQMLIIFTDNKHELISNWLFYKLKYFNLNYNDCDYYKLLIKIPELDKIRFGLYTKSGNDEEDGDSGVEQQFEHTFLYCKFNWGIQESFFNDAIKDIKQGMANTNLVNDLIKIACRSSSFSIELLDMVKSGLKIKVLSIEQLKSFKTMQLVDYVLLNFNNGGGDISSNHFSDLLQLNLFNYQIANHIKTKYKFEFDYEIGRIFIDSSIHTTINNSNNSLNYKFIQENWNDNFRSINFILSKFNNCNEFEQFITTNLPSIKLATKNKPINFYGQNKQLSIYQTNFMYNLKSQLFLNNTFIRPSDSIAFLTIYLRNEFIGLFNNGGCTLPYNLSSSKSIYMVLNEISKRGDTQTLDFLLSDKFKDKEFKKYILKYVLFKSSKYGQLSILQYIATKQTLKIELNYLKLLNSNQIEVSILNNNEKEKKRKSNRKSNVISTTANTKKEKEKENYLTIYNKSFKSLQIKNNKQFIDPNFAVDDWHFIFVKYLFPNGFIKLIKFITTEYEYKINLDWLNELINKEKHIISINNYLILPQNFKK